jgi:hypothetical protein
MRGNNYKLNKRRMCWGDSMQRVLAKKPSRLLNGGLPFFASGNVVLLMLIFSVPNFMVNRNLPS